MDNRRILYADNDRTHLDTRSELLEREGYQVVKAYSPDEAEKILERENIHLAILDIRLLNDDDEGDISGILLAKDERFRRIPKIMVTGYPTYEYVREVYGALIDDEPVAYAFLSKKEGTKALIEAVNTAFNKALGINWDLRIVWDEKGFLSLPYLVLLFQRNLEPGLLLSRSSELEDLFRKLFPADEQITMVRINWLQDGCACLSLFSMNEDFTRQVIAVVGLNETITEKRKRIEKFIEQESAIFAKPCHKVTQHFAGFAYNIQDTGDGPLQVGSSFFSEATDKNIRTALENLFRQAPYHTLQNDRPKISKSDLAASYRDRLGIKLDQQEYEKVHNIVQSLVNEMKPHFFVRDISLQGNEIEIIFTNGQIYRGPDPISALFNPQAFSNLPAATATTFGGITSDYLLIDQEGSVYPTDMSSLVESHILEDFVSLECEFHFDRVAISNLYTLWEFEKQLGESRSLNELLPIGNVEPECRKGLAAIQSLRKLVSEKTGTALEPYLISLFYYTLKPLLKYDPQTRLAKHKIIHLAHRLVAASMFVSQIQRENGGEDGEKAESNGLLGMQVNEAGREVVIDGRQVRLTQTEFKLLLYLYKKPNCLCTWEEILSEVFEIKGTSTKSDKGLLNTHIDRLRKKIDLNPARHRYIVTIRGEGYLLDLKY